jgi:3-oxoacyl-[acyl-carrier protein] reductase
MGHLDGQAAVVTGTAQGIGRGIADLLESEGAIRVQGQTHTLIDELTDADWDAVVDANLRTAFNCTRAAARLMKAARYGRIVNISSGAGRSVSLTGIQAYTSAKVGQIVATGRTGTPHDIARGVLFFAAPDAGWVSGQTISIYGGHSLF